MIALTTFKAHIHKHGYTAHTADGMSAAWQSFKGVATPEDLAAIQAIGRGLGTEAFLKLFESSSRGGQRVGAGRVPNQVKGEESATRYNVSLYPSERNKVVAKHGSLSQALKDIAADIQPDKYIESAD